MTLYDSVISNLKGVIGSRKDGVLLINLDNEYQLLSGEPLPIRKLGYNSLQDFINNHQDLFSLQGTGKFCRIFNLVGKIENDTTLNLINLIQHTEPKYKKRGFDNQYYCRNQGYQTHYGPSFQTGYNQYYTPNYAPSFQTFRPPNPTYGFSNFNINFPNPVVPELSQPTNNIYQHPNIGYMPKTNGTEENKKNNLLVPIQCLMSAQKNTEKNNVLVISDDDEVITPVLRPTVSTQTTTTVFKQNKRLFGTLQSLQLVNMIIDVIITYKPLQNMEVYKVRIEKELYFQFQQLTGFRIDPVLFHDYVVCAIDSARIQHIYKNLIYLDPSKNICLFNIKSTNNAAVNLPDYEFEFQSEYVVEIVKIFHDNLIAYKFPAKVNLNLNWKKAIISDQAKEIIESQLFWSWIPGSLCLVQLPFKIVKEFNLSSVERAIIVSTEMAVIKDVVLQSSQLYLIHSTSFYLIDHEREVNNIFSCASSFLEVKQKAKINNDTEVAFVCNMSVCAKNTPSKIQFTRLENYKDVSHSFLDADNKLKPNTRIILKSIKKMEFVFHFQPIYSCLSKVYGGVEVGRSITDYKDVVEIVEHKPRKEVRKVEEEEEEYNEVIVISDSDDEVCTRSKVNGYLDTRKVPLTEELKSVTNDHTEAPQQHPCISPITTNKAISIVSYSESEDDHDTVNSELKYSNPLSNNISMNTTVLSNSIISYLENNSNPPRKCLIPLTIDMNQIFNGHVVKVLHIQTGSAVLMLFDSVKLMRRDIRMMALRKQVLQKAEKVLVGDFFIWRPLSDTPGTGDYLLVEVMQLVSKTTVLTNNVHRGLLAVVNINELFCLPEEHNGDIFGSIQILIGPSVGAFDLHMFPDWFTPDNSCEFSSQLFTAFFGDDGKLILEYFEEPCRFLNLEIIGAIERSLTVNHCNVKSRQFIEMLAKSLLQSRLFVGNILQMIDFNDGIFDDLSITKVICKVTGDDRHDIWFASVLVRNGYERDCYEKLSPHNFVDNDQFCVDRVMFDERRQSLRLLEYQNVYIDVPDNFEGLYRFDRQQISGSLKGNEEFFTRYMLATAATIPDLKYLCNKLIFDIRPF